MVDAKNKTQATDVDVRAFLDAVEHPVRRADALVLDALFRKITGWQPKMWGPTIVGYGSYHYKYDSGREGDCNATGFSPRKASQSIYIMPGYQEYDEILSRLGKYKIGKACLYVNKLADIDIDVLEELIRAGLRDLSKIYPVSPT
ncbi:DUF1801 domain-containing protein [Octadecabacter ascidiaceicola]|uniref:YdhG-like domain-containing protein n=1 Tax=Octadecabacter ascidiaceicola TaxID=1655543 RepID=A0A238KRP7_9RHOB|nr:DUF1801 domain-containing protein [Octadecabacter ascidiaceicola]SMX45503.1 hypothetical protein OCA8868_03316 [Octadecabacter ascidiaceicola]